MTRITGPDCAVVCNSINTRTNIGRSESRRRAAAGVEQREQSKDSLATQPDRENELSQTNRGVRVCA